MLSTDEAWVSDTSTTIVARTLPKPVWNPSTHAHDIYKRLRNSIETRTVTVGICGLGYVGLPLGIATARARFGVVGFDIDEDKVRQLAAGRSYIDTVSSGTLIELRDHYKFQSTSDFDRLVECDIIIICVPTPLTKNREPNLAYVESTAMTILDRLRPGQLIILESTTYPGTTNQVVKPILERSGLVAGEDFFLAFSPEREDPGNAQYETTTIPKVVSGHGDQARELASLFYGSFIEKIVQVSTNDTAEAVKITENVFRAVNIALVNELKLIYDAMGIDVWEVIDAAKTKPFGYMPFYPGPGLGGHCVPIDPFYLTWKSREYGLPTRFIELAGEINTAMPRHVVGRLEEALDTHHSKTLGNARILLLGMAYKKNVSDTRESPALKLMEIMEKRGARVDFHDPHVNEIPLTREHPTLNGRRSVGLDESTICDYDAIIIVTDHDKVDYQLLANAALIVDTRNACARRGLQFGQVIKA
jgi:UDP-N-acetyl-D-glucosamine dehydrogenase